MTSARRRDALDESLAGRPEFMVSLEVAVPMWQQRWRGRPADQQVARARSLGQTVAGHGDSILFSTKGARRRVTDGVVMEGKPSSAEAFNALAEGIALLSLLSAGGVTIFGRHFHDRCHATTLDDCIDLAS